MFLISFGSTLNILILFSFYLRRPGLIPRRLVWIPRGGIDALSERLQVELPGLRGFSAQHIRFMRQFYEEWYQVVGIINKATPAIRYLPSSESPSVVIRQLPIDELSQEAVAVMGAEDIDGVRRVLVEHGKKKRKSRRRKAAFVVANGSENVV